MKTKILSSVIALALISGASAFGSVAAEGNYKIDIDHSNIGFEVSHMGIGIVVGRFDKFSGDITLDSKGGSKVVVTIETSSINTKQTQRDTHLRSADFFNVATLPTAKFESTKVELDQNGDPKSMDGNLTLHGVTKAVTIALKPLGAGPGQRGEIRAGFRGTTTINRKDFGMSSLLAIAGEEVLLTLNVEGVKQ